MKPTPLTQQHNMQALSGRAIREAAQVSAEWRKFGAGYVWRPPYTVDVTRLLKAGENTLRIVVGNTAINELSGRALPTYRLLNQRYGERFVPQDMTNLQPLPSGILGALRLNLGRPAPAR